MTTPATFKQSDVQRAVAGALKAGLPIGRVEVAPDGKITIIAESVAANDDNGGCTA